MLICFNSIKMWDFSETRVTDGPTLAQICENAPEKACWLRNEIYDILLSKPEGKFQRDLGMWVRPDVPVVEPRNGC